MTKNNVLTIGNAIVDIISRGNDALLKSLNLEKSAMRLINKHEADNLLALLPNQKRISGGSAANSAAGISTLGGNTKFIGKIANDELGDLYQSDLTQLSNIEFDTKRYSGPESTAISSIIVTEDGERTMNTYLGASLHLNKEDIIENDILNANVLFFEGYLWDQNNSRDAVLKAIEIARSNNDIKIAITLSDANCVTRHHKAFNELINSGKIDLVLANKKELQALYTTNNIDEALLTAAQHNSKFAVTLGSKGSAVIDNTGIKYVSTKPVDNIVDLVGAGDAFAAGLLLGYSRGIPLEEAAVEGCAFAAEIIQVEGARLSNKSDNLKL